MLPIDPSLWPQPVSAIGGTLLAYLGGLWVYQRSGRNPFLHPAILAIGAIIALLSVLDASHTAYFEHAQLIHWLLGPATVALAIPLYQHIDLIRRMAVPVVAGLVAGSVAGAGIAVLIAWGMGASVPTLLSLAPKSVTTPIAMGVAEQIGGLPSLAAGMVLITGAIGCMLAPWLYRWLGEDDPAVQGFALGVTSHGFGTAKAFELGPAAGAFAALGLGLAGLLTAFTLPWVVALFSLM